MEGSTSARRRTTTKWSTDPSRFRIYLFDNERKPLSARDVHAQMTLQLPRENGPRRLAFQYVILPSAATDQDYVMAVLDIRPLQDRETSVTLDFSGSKTN